METFVSVVCDNTVGRSDFLGEHGWRGCDGYTSAICMFWGMLTENRYAHSNNNEN